MVSFRAALRTVKGLAILARRLSMLWFAGRHPCIVVQVQPDTTYLLSQQERLRHDWSCFKASKLTLKVQSAVHVTQDLSQT